MVDGGGPNRIPLAALAEIAPENVVTPLAIEPTRGWLISPDHGATLATLASRDYALWARVVTDFAELQQQTVQHGQRLTDAGLASLDPGIAGNFVSNIAKSGYLVDPGTVFTGEDGVATVEYSIDVTASGWTLGRQDHHRSTVRTGEAFPRVQL